MKSRKYLNELQQIDEELVHLYAGGYPEIAIKSTEKTTLDEILKIKKSINSDDRVCSKYRSEVLEYCKILISVINE